MNHSLRIDHLLSVVRAQRHALGNVDVRTILASLAQDPTAHDLTYQEIGYAHVAMFSTDGRHLLQAMDCFRKAGRDDLLPMLLTLAKRYGEIRGVSELDAYGRETGNAQLIVTDFADWFARFGVSRFDAYNDVEANVHFILPADAELIQQIVRRFFPDTDTFWNTVLASLRADETYPAHRLALLTKLASGEEPVIEITHLERTADERIRAHCAAHNLVILQQLQVGRDGLKACSSVFLVLDQEDGIVKILKELPAGRFDRLGSAQEEGTIYEALGPIHGLPRFYGRTPIDRSLTCLRLGVCYGQSLTDYVRPDTLLDLDEACLVIGRIAEVLARMHAQHTLYLDLRPHNVKIDGDEVHLLDLGDSHVLRPDEHGTVATHLHDPRYTAPEVVTGGVASQATDLFQLGVLFYELVTGRHPFVTLAPQGNDETDEETHLRYALSTLLNHHPKPVMEGSADARLAWMSKLLAHGPHERPTADVIAKALLGAQPRRAIRHRARSLPATTHGTVLFPARMGIPHRGHIDFMARLLELGYKLVVPIEHSYTCSADDPLPKWIVRKMIARSLQRKGFDLTNVHLYCAPLFNTTMQYRLHFAMMEGAHELVAVASGNSDVHQMFANHLPIIDQSMLFGEEGAAYETRSWGAKLRAALRMNDRETFRTLIAEGAEDLLSFDEMRDACLNINPLLFVWGHEDWGSVRVVLRDQGGNLLAERRVNTYSCPEDTLLGTLPNAFWTNRFARESELSIDGTLHCLRYEGITLDTHKNALLSYCLL